MALAITLSIAACGGSGPAAKPPALVTIGLLAPTSGPNAAAGQDEARGARLAVDLANSTSDQFRPFPTGLFGAHGASKLALVTADTASDRQRGVDETARLASVDRVAGIAGAFDPDVTLDASQRSERLATPFISGDVSLSALTQGGLDWFFRTSPDAHGFGTALFSLIGAQGPPNGGLRIALLHSDDSTGNDLAAMMHEFADEAGQQIVSDITYPSNSNLSAQLELVKASNPDILYFVAVPGATDVLASALNRSGFRPRAVIVHGDNIAAQPGGSAYDSLSREVAWTPVLAQRNPRANAVAAAYQRRYGSPMTEEAASSFTAVMTLAYAIQNAGNADRSRIRTALLALRLPGAATIMPWTGVAFDGSHQNTLANSVIEQLGGGRENVVYPRDLATAGFRWTTTSPNS
jgi:branched-chain amino acid transport system substrate-binding protein